MSYKRKSQTNNFEMQDQSIPGQMTIGDYNQSEDTDNGFADETDTMNDSNIDIVDDLNFTDIDTVEQSSSENFTSSDNTVVGYYDNPNATNNEGNDLVDNTDYTDANVSEQTISSVSSDYPHFVNDDPSIEFQKQINVDSTVTADVLISSVKAKDKLDKGKNIRNKNRSSDKSSCPIDGPGIIYIDHGKRNDTMEKKMTFSADTVEKINRLLGNSLSNVEKSKVLDAVLNKALNEMLLYQSKGEFGVFYRPVERERLI